MYEPRRTGNVRFVRKYWLFGPVIREVEYEYDCEYDVGCGLRGFENLKYWVRE